MLDEITAALQAAFPDLPIYYLDDSETIGTKIYDYIVVYREDIEWKVTSRGDLSRYYAVVLVHKNYIPEDEETKVLDVLRDLPGLKEVPGGNPVFGRVKQAAGTKVKQEYATYRFVAAQKRLPKAGG